MNHGKMIAKLLSCTSFSLLAGLAAGQEANVYHGFTLLDPARAAVTENAFVVVEGSRITQVGSGRPPRRDGWALVDMFGRYALPGLFDTHAHVTMGPIKVEIQNGAPTLRFEVIDDLTRYHALIALAFGVTTIRNPAGNAEANAHYEAMIASGAWLGPEALQAGDLFEPSFGNHPKTDIEWDREITRQKELGMGYVKLYVGLTEPELERGIERAHAHGMKTIGHLDAVSWTRAIELGIDELTHALPTSADLLVEPARSEYLASRRSPDAKYMYRWFELVDYDSEPFQAMLRTLVEKKTHVDLTLVVNEIVYFYDAIDELKYHPLRYMHPDSAFRENWQQTMSASHIGWTEDDYRRAHAALPKVLELAKRLYDAGVRLSIGTDGTGGGTNLVRELELHVQSGIPAWEVLRLATSGAAERLGIEERTGSLAAGFEADIVFLNADPLQNIENVGVVDTVLSDGRAHRTQELIEMAAALAR
jgi:imidazolonepropionase-like amidohydrolase